LKIALAAVLLLVVDNENVSITHIDNGLHMHVTNIWDFTLGILILGTFSLGLYVGFRLDTQYR